MKALLATLLVSLTSLYEMLKATTDEKITSIIQEIIDLKENMQLVIEKELNKGTDESTIERKINFFVEGIKDAEARLLELTSEALPSRLHDLIKTNVATLLDSIQVGDGLRLSIVFLPDDTIQVGKAKKHNPNAVGSTNKTTSGTSEYMIGDFKTTNGSEAYKKLVKDLGEKFEETTGRKERTGSFSAPAELKAIANKLPNLVKIVEIAQATTEETKQEPAQATTEEPAQATTEETKQEPAQATTEEPAQATKETPAQATKETPAQATKEEPAQATKETPAQAPKKDAKK